MSSDNAATRLDKVEMLVAHQEQTIEALNAALLAQAKEVATLKRELSRLGEQVGEIGSHPALAEPDKPPPHY